MKKRRENIKKFPKKIVSSKKINEKAKRQKKKPKGKRKSQRAKGKGKRKSQRAKTVIEKNHTKTHPVLIFRYQHKRHPKEQRLRTQKGTTK